MQNQLQQIRRQFQRQPPVLQASLLLTPFLAAAVVVLAAVLVTGPRPTSRAPETPPALTPTAPSAAVAIRTTAPASSPAASPAPGVPLIVATTAPAPDAASTPEPSPVATDVFRVVNTEGAGASLRREAGASGQRIKVIPEGREVEALGPTREVDGRTWRSVRDADGTVGWVSTEFLADARVDPRVTPTPAPLTIQVEDLTASPARGEEASISIRTRPGVRCEIRVFLYGPSTLPRAGLEPMTADDEGVCGWTWTVPPETVPGTWRYLLAVGVGERRVTREVSFTVR